MSFERSVTLFSLMNDESIIIRKIPLPPLSNLAELAIFLTGEGRVRENQCAQDS
jgi:hypothetical protein